MFIDQNRGEIPERTGDRATRWLSHGEGGLAGMHFIAQEWH